MANKAATAYERPGEWAGVKIHPAPTGWIIESRSQIQGCTTGGRVLVPYSDRWPRGADLNGPDTMPGSKSSCALGAEMLEACDLDLVPDMRVLDHGQKVH